MAPAGEPDELQQATRRRYPGSIGPLRPLQHARRPRARAHPEPRTTDPRRTRRTARAAGRLSARHPPRALRARQVLRAVALRRREDRAPGRPRLFLRRGSRPAQPPAHRQCPGHEPERAAVRAHRPAARGDGELDAVLGVDVDASRHCQLRSDVDHAGSVSAQRHAARGALPDPAGSGRCRALRDPPRHRQADHRRPAQPHARNPVAHPVAAHPRGHDPATRAARHGAQQAVRTA